MKKRVLIMMSTYNGEKYILEQLQSILNQKTDYSILIRIRDDGSTDQTCKIIKKIQIQNPTMIELIEGQNIGYNASFFELLSEADGYDYYAFSDQDDVWLPTKIQTAVNWLEAEKKNYNGPLLYASTSYFVHNDMKVYGVTRKQLRPFTLNNCIVQNICPGHNQVFNQHLLDIVKHKIKNVSVYAYDSWISSLAVLYGRILFNNTPQTYYRQHQTNELGAAENVFSQLAVSFKRCQKGDGFKVRKQIESFVKCNRKDLDEKFLDELEKFISAKTFLKRLSYVLHSKLYRQRPIETFALKCAILFGKI